VGVPDGPVVSVLIEVGILLMTVALFGAGAIVVRRRLVFVGVYVRSGGL